MVRGVCTRNRSSSFTHAASMYTSTCKRAAGTSDVASESGAGAGQQHGRARRDAVQQAAEARKARGKRAVCAPRRHAHCGESAKSVEGAARASE
eukprot:5289114-Prymnesium_polylepis.1